MVVFMVMVVGMVADVVIADVVDVVDVVVIVVGGCWWWRHTLCLKQAAVNPKLN